MLEHDGIDISEGIHANKFRELQRCIICNYCYFLKLNLIFQPKTCDGCHDLMQKAMSFSNVAIVFIKENDSRNNFWYMSKDEAINIMKISDLREKSGTL